ncbi:MAG TPA: hypothetical protein VII73_02365 [Caulobacteraceae bacterium]
MRTALMTTAVTAGLLLAPALAAGAPGVTMVAPPSAAPIFYCPKAMAKPAACLAPKRAVVQHHRGHARGFEHARYHAWREDRGPSARRAWMLGYKAGQAAQPRQADGRDYEMHGDWKRQRGAMGGDHPAAFARRDGAGREHDARGWSERRGQAGPRGERSAQVWREDRHEEPQHGARAEQFAYSRHEEVRTGGGSRGQQSDHCRGHEGAEHGGQAWRSGQGGGYKIYHLAGRDQQGYLVWSGKPRL